MTDHWESFVAIVRENDDEVCDSSLSYRELEQGGPPVHPLQFPTPSVAPSILTSVRAIDHRTGRVRVLEHVLMKRPSSSSPENPNIAFLIKKKISKTKFGSIRKGLVLQRKFARAGSAAAIDADENGYVWVSTETMVAIKISSWHTMRHYSDDASKNPLREVAALQLVGNYNQYVAGCLEVLQDEMNLYTVLPFHNHGSNLHNLLFGNPDDPIEAVDHGRKPFSEVDARDIFRQLLKGLYHLQCKGIYHRDLSLDNLIFVNNQVKIIGVEAMSLRVPYSDPCNEGCVTDKSEGILRRLLMTQGKDGRTMYLAPEVLKEHGGFDGFAADLWAAGIVLFVLCIGLAPFKIADDSEKRFARISKGGLRKLLRNLNISISREVTDLIQNMLWENPRDRLSLIEVMQHPWVMGTTFPPEAVSVMSEASVEESIGSVSSTEPTTTQDYRTKIDNGGARLTPSKRDQKEVSFETISISLIESRESSSETREDSDEPTSPSFSPSFRPSCSKFGPMKLIGDAQQLRNNAQQLGPRLKHAVTHVRPFPRGARCEAVTTEASSSADDASASEGELPPVIHKRGAGISPLFNRLKITVPNKTPPPPISRQTPKI